MADLTSVGVTSGVPSSGTGTVGTINYLAAVGLPISNGSTSAPVTVAITGTASAVTSTMSALVVSLSPNSSVRTMTLSSNPTVILSSNPTVIPSSVFTVTLSSNPTVIASSDMAITSITSGTVAIGNAGTIAAVKSGLTLASSTDAALVVQISPLSVNPNGQQPSSNSSPVVISSNQSPFAIYVTSGTVTMSSNPTVIPSSVTSVSLSTTVGLTISSVIISTTTNATLVSSTPRQLCKVECFNLSTTPGFLKMYNLSSVPTAGSSLVFNRYPVPTNGFISTVEISDTYSTGLAYTFTANLIDSDTTAIQTSSTYVVNLHYR